ncbi:helix-turn-helix transcriptional regulator [Flavisolibacter nicotianae]|uniref:helix-turn-helix transcriptional regulator n=1 Tax=Flavisolibacter nicotianae TaxID=2364882 RepID=UPI000EAC5EE8|nr:WYL domain-containing protein [Flavisolibacter nicotianae]
MPDNKNFAARIEIIDECLRNHYRRWTLQNLIDAVNEKLNERFGISAGKRTIQDDLKYLKEQKVAPIEKRKEGPTTYFYYSDSSYSIKNLPIGSEEISLLNDAIHILKQVNDFKVLEDVNGIIHKLQNTVNTNVPGGPAIIQFEKHTVAFGTEHIDDLFSAIKEKTVLRITYQSFKATEPTEGLFHPYLLREYRNRWFLIGSHDGSEKVTNLALDRIKAIKPSLHPFVANPFFDPETYFNNLVGVSLPEGEPVQAVEIKIAPSQAPYIRTKPIHHTQEILKVYANGALLIRLQLVVNYELRSVLLGYGCDVEVLKPIALRNSMKEIFETAASCYR